MLIHHLMRPNSSLFSLFDPALHNVGTRLDRTESSAYDDIIEWAPEPRTSIICGCCGLWLCLRAASRALRCLMWWVRPWSHNYRRRAPRRVSRYRIWLSLPHFFAVSLSLCLSISVSCNICCSSCASGVSSATVCCSLSDSYPRQMARQGSLVLHLNKINE